MMFPRKNTKMCNKENGVAASTQDQQNASKTKESIPIDVIVLDAARQGGDLVDDPDKDLQTCCTDAETAEWSVSSGGSFNTTCSQRSILRADSRLAEPRDRSPHERQQKVRFSTVQLRDYPIVLGDHPCVSFGPPIAIDWEYHEHEPRDVDEYEFAVAPTRKTSLKALMLNYYQRNYLLKDHYTELDIKEVMREVKKINARRENTKRLSSCHKVEACVESARRKFKRALHLNADI